MTGNLWSTHRSKGIFHVPKVAKFLDNKCLDISNFIDLIQYHLICQLLANLSGIVSESIVSTFRKRNGKCLHCYPYPPLPSPTKATEILKGREGGVQKEAISEGVGCCLERFFSRGLRMVSYS